MDWLSRLLWRFREPTSADRASSSVGRVVPPAESASFDPGSATLRPSLRRVAPRYPPRAPAHRPPTKPSRITWCDLCDLDRRFCVHAWEDRRAKELVYATGLTNTFHSRIDCRELSLPRAATTEAGATSSLLSTITRHDARSRGLDPCRTCLGTAPATRRR